MKIQKILILLALVFIMTGAKVNNGVQLKSTWYSTKAFNGRKTADGTMVRHSGQRIVALSPDMFKKGFDFGDSIHVVSKSDPKVNGYWTVRDKTAPGLRNHIDFLLHPSEGKGFHNGKVTVTIVNKAKKRKKRG